MSLTTTQELKKCSISARYIGIQQNLMSFGRCLLTAKGNYEIWVPRPSQQGLMRREHQYMLEKSTGILYERFKNDDENWSKKEIVGR